MRPDTAGADLEVLAGVDQVASLLVLCEETARGIVPVGALLVATTR
jgi:hypothetical protein